MATYNKRVDNQYALLSIKYIGVTLHAKQAIDKRIRLVCQAHQTIDDVCWSNKVCW